MVGARYSGSKVTEFDPPQSQVTIGCMTMPLDGGSESTTMRAGPDSSGHRGVQERRVTPWESQQKARGIRMLGREMPLGTLPLQDIVVVGRPAIGVSTRGTELCSEKAR